MRGRLFSLCASQHASLADLHKLAEELKATTSLNGKLDKLRQNPALLPLLEQIYDPQQKFHITSPRIREHPAVPVTPPHSSLSCLLSDLSARRVTGHAAAQACHQFLSRHVEFAGLIRAAIDKNLKARIGHQTLLRVRPQPVTPSTMVYCPLGHPVEACEQYLRDSLASGEEWYQSRKYDGIRAILSYDSSTQALQILSRRHAPFAVFNPALREKLFSAIRAVKQSVILDGELVYLGPDGAESFSKAVSVVKSKEPKPVDNLVYRAFDCYSGAFDSIADCPYADRLKTLYGILPVQEQDPAVGLSAIRQDLLKAPIDLDAIRNQAISENIEGYILRRNTRPYNGRTRDLLKVKPWQDAEFTVTGVEVGPMRYVSEGIEKQDDMLLSVSVELDGHLVKVGSGFNLEQRLHWARHPDELINSVITVKYQSESKSVMDADRPASLRFPVFKAFHGREREE